MTLDDEPGLRDLLVDASVVINCAGPFTLAGDAVARAAIDTGTHYIDSTGEQPFIAMMFDRHGAAAERAGVALLPALGFDYLPGDLIARIAAEEHEPLRELVVAYAVKGFGMTRGTMRSTLEIMKGGDLIYEGGGWRPAPRGATGPTSRSRTRSVGRW
ncbi:MAG TPA: saccharopine dehydrogenase NADP-binding domain-containing protein [Thermoleophilaceae bacterium]|nr:saccharopine dehydrogenase NADP-binding domain-containing protein [Thermoleophilaceae bacterium]